jgi:DNA-binding NarL/FixJ family response regulator
VHSPSRFLSLPQIQRDLGLTRTQILTLIQTGELPAFQILGEWRVERTMLNDLVDRLYERASITKVSIPPEGSGKSPHHGLSVSTDSLAPPSAARTRALTPQQQRVARLLVRGLSNAEIAAQLDLEVSTVKTHISRMLQRLDLRSRHQLMAHLWQSGEI